MISYIRDFTIPLIVVLFVERPLMQFLPIFMFIGFRFTFVVLVRPSKDRLVNLVNLVTETGYFIILIFKFVLIFFGGMMSEEFTYIVIGNGIIVLVCSLLFMNLTFMMIKNVQEVINFF